MDSQENADAASPAAEALPAAPVSVPVKFAYGAGSLVDGVSTGVIGFQFLLYAALLGLPGTLVGAAAAISLGVDAFADPVLGSLSDDTRSRWGRRIPYMAVGAPLVALGLGLALSPPRGLPIWPLFAWLVGTSLFMRVAVSIFNVPFIALGAEISEDYAERSSVVAYRTVFAILGPLAATWLGYGVFLSTRNGGLYRIGGYAPLAWTGAILILIGGLVSVLGIRRFAAGLPENPPDARALYRRFPAEIAEIFRNASFRVLFFASVLFYAAQGVAGALGNHMNLFVWKLSSGEMLASSIPNYVGLIIAVPMTPPLARRMEKRTMLIGSVMVILVVQAALPLLRALHIFTLTGAAAAVWIGAFAFMSGMAVIFAVISLASMMADAADEHELLFARRRQGLYFAGIGFAGKAATGLGALVGGVGLDAIGFPHNLANVAAAAQIAPGALDNLAMIAGPLTAGASALGAFLLVFYHIDKKRHDEISRALAARRRVVA